MLRRHDSRPLGRPRPLRSRRATTLVAAFALLTTGCLSPLAKRSTDLATATPPVIDQAAAAYSSANAIHYMRTDYDAIAQFDVPSPVYNPRTIQPLLSDQDIKARLAVLSAFQAYVQSVVAVSNGANTPEVEAAATSSAKSLADLGNKLAPSIESTFGIAVATASTTQTTVTTGSGATTTTATTTASTPVDPITPSIQNGIGTAVYALEQFLISRKVKKELPKIVESMDPNVKLLCDLLESDITILRGVEDRDYNYVINRETLFIRESSSPASSTRLDAEARRQMIMGLPVLARQQQASDQQLTLLSNAVGRLYAAHHALALEAEGNNPESLKQKLGDLAAAGENLGNYSSLSASDSDKDK
jgi:hypothetical protein